jgi:chemosensory pili system protein ChpA (sensor histidine kinase/response regulator)
MGGAPDNDSLVNVFVTEAGQGLGRLRTLLEAGPAQAPDDVHGTYIIAHTLRGAASLYGYAAVAELAEVLENIFDRPAERLQQEWAMLVPALQDLVDTLQSQIERIGRDGTEDAACAARWKARFPVLLMARAAGDGPLTALPDTYLNPTLDTEVLSYFAPETQEYLDAMEAAVLRLEKDPGNAEIIQQLFRTAHTLKGSAYTVGFKAIGDITHHVEDIMGAIRDGRMGVSSGVTDVIFRTVDVIRLLMRMDAKHVGRARDEFSAVLRQLQQVNAGVVEAPAQAGAGRSEDAAGSEQPGAESVAVGAAAEGGEGGERERQEAPAGGDRAGREKEKDESAVIRVSRDRLERLMNLVGELVTSRGRLEQRLVTLEHLSQQVLACRTRMHDTVRTFEERHAFTIPTPSFGTSSSTGSGEGPSAFAMFPGLEDLGSLEFDKYDDFNILARRIAEVSADVSEAMNQLNTSIRKARDDMSQLQQLTTGMRDEIARARMVPVGTPFTRFRRAIREISKASGKDVTLTISGANTEVDTGVVERLVDPLIHLVRNAVFHGIELPGARLDKGKPPTGTVYLHAAHRGNALVIEVEDDGAGLDIGKIKAKAVALGLLRAELAASLSDPEAIKLIFLPGFSTADDVGDQAGRGVGLDVVKRALEAMNGQIEVETEAGIGTKFTLRLPLTLLISTALLVRVGTTRYALPLPSVREVIVPGTGSVQDVGGRAMLHLGDETVEVRSLAQLLGAEGPGAPAQRPVVIVRMATGVLGVEVDELLGRQEIVIKSLGGLRPFQESCFGGATIDPDGSVILVLDVGRLLGGPRRREALVAQPALADLSGAGPGEPAEEGWRLLLIDDSLSVRKFVGKMLESAGYHVDTAVDGEEGLRKASATSYNLIITDLEMPKLNGYEVIQALRERPNTKTLPILVMTTRAGEKHRQMALSMGASGYIAKPVEERSFIQEVGRWTGRESAARR